MKIARFVILLGLLGLLACATVRESQEIQSWEGKKYEQLVAALGPPQEVMNDSQGGKVLTYFSVETRVIPGMSFAPYSVTSPNMTTTQTYGTPASVKTKTERRLFYVNSEGVVYRTAYREE